MAKTKGKTEEEIEKEAQDEKPEEDEEAEEETEDDEEFEDIEVNPGSTSSFRYPVFRRAAPIRIQPITAPLEIELEDAPSARENKEENADQYKPAPEKNYSLAQKYELPGSKSYEEITPKSITSPASPSSFRPEGAGYPGQQQDERKYDSGLEQQTKEQEKRRREV